MADYGAHNPALTLDIEQQQVAVWEPDDANFGWHGRLLLVKLEGARWIVATPTMSLQVLDLAAKTMKPLFRKSPLPVPVAGDFYGFAPLPDDVLSDLVQQAVAMGSILGAVPTVSSASSSSWYFADTAYEHFGEAAEIASRGNPGRMVTRGASALLETEADGWTFVERVSQTDLNLWKDEKRHGPGRDPRVLAQERDSQGQRFMSFRDALGVMKFAKQADFPFKGPPAVMETLEGVRASGEDLSGYPDYYFRMSGLSPTSGVAHTFRILFNVLLHLICYDQLNSPQLASAETICRHILQIQKAVKRNPKNPDFRGLSIMINSRLNTSSADALLTGDFAKFVAEEQKGDAFIMKQQRLYAEEADKLKK